MIFETERLYVTQWESTDLKALHTLYNDPAIHQFILPRLTIEETRHIFENQLDLYHTQFPFGRYFIVEKSSGRFIGILLLRDNINREGVEIGYALTEDFWKMGYATEIVKESIHWIFEAGEYTSLYAVTEFGNENSKNVLLRCGFSLEESYMEYGKEMNVFGFLKSEMPVLQQL